MARLGIFTISVIPAAIGVQSGPGISRIDNLREQPSETVLVGTARGAHKL
jgi:hypothetical protein